MLDIKFIRQNTEAVKQAIKNKGLALDLDRLLKVDEERRSLIARSEAIRAEQKKTTDRERAKALKEEFKALELQLKIADEEYDRLMDQVPTIPSHDTPIGRDADENIEVYRWGDIPEFDFKPKDHIELGTSLDIIDFDRGVKTAGFRGYYLKNQGAQLAMALMMFAFNKMVEKGYKPMIPPTLIGEQFLYGSGYFKESKYNPSIDEIYRVESSEEGEPKKYLVGTAEPSLLAYHSGEVLKERDLPIKFAGLSQCYRSEIGSYGKDTKGIYRVHECMKVEQVVIS